MPASSTFTAAERSRLPGPAWLQAEREAAFERFAAMDALPTEAEEIWRYSRISNLDLDAFTPAFDPGAQGPVPDRVATLLGAIGERAGLAVTREGGLATLEAGEGRATIGRLGDDGDGAGAGLLGSVAAERDAFSTLNAAFSADPLVLRVPNGVAERRTFVVVHWIARARVAVFPRTIVQVGEAAEATVIEVVMSEDVVALVAPVTELDLAPTANLRYITVQDLGPRVWQVATQASRVERESTLLSATVALGGDYARQRTDSRLVGAGATGNLLAVYFGDARQMHDFRTLQDHRAPKSTSDLLFKGAVAGSAHSVYSGLIRVEKRAAGTNAFQTNRNLVLAEGARADSVPNLEIEENELRCSHASAVGPVDEEQRYYLESRGVPTAVANRLIVLGFLNEVIDRIPVEGLRPYLRDALAAKLHRADTNLLGGVA